ncbi:MAG: hypothetical protein JSV12_00935 [Candidatus Bathyarchaeota archaeon]|nr:MAG: hypothetical protein JSV12_00935 [Candidatus Bathyarchaeota archaeon]
MDQALPVKVEYDEFGFVKGYLCPCGGKVKLSYKDDIGTKFFKCEKCGQQLTKLKSSEKQHLETTIEDLTKIVTLEEISEILNSTIKHDERNKLITFLAMLLTYTEEDQINISFTAESSTGKSYIPLELAWYFPRRDVIEYSYVSPTAFYHEYGEIMTDPDDTRNVEEKKKHKIKIVDLHQKVLIFIDQPHDQLLQRLRPLLSHDRKTLVSKITDHKLRSGLRTKTILIRGFPTVLFCTSKFNMEDQERTRLLLLSPETSQQKIKDAILLKIEKESNREKFRKFMESDPKRVWLRKRVTTIATAGTQHLVISEELRQKIANTFFEKHNNLIPRHQRDISRLLALIKAHALLNCWHRETIEKTIVVNEEDVKAGFDLYSEISTANELGLSPEVFNIYIKLRNQIPDEGMTRKDLQKMYYTTFHRTIGKKRLNEVLSILTSTGLFMEDPDPNDRRRKMYTPCQRVFNFDDEKAEKQSQTELEFAPKLNTLQGGVLTFKNVKSIVQLDEPYEGTCSRCDKRHVLYHCATTVNDEWGDVCQDCGMKIQEKLRGGAVG